MQERRAECRARGEWWECYIPWNVAKHSGECPQTFREIPPNIPGNVLKYAGNAANRRNVIFWGMSSNNLGNVLKHSGECHQTFRGMLPNIPGDVANF